MLVRTSFLHHGHIKVLPNLRKEKLPEQCGQNSKSAGVIENFACCTGRFARTVRPASKVSRRFTSLLNRSFPPFEVLKTLLRYHSLKSTESAITITCLSSAELRATFTKCVPVALFFPPVHG
jgi:hypothetical protein